MEGIRNVMIKKDTCFIALIWFYESKTKIQYNRLGC